MIIQKVNQIGMTTVHDVVGHLHENVPLQREEEASGSRYAPGRERGWLNHEGPLNDKRTFEPRPTTDRLWSWLVRVWEESGMPGKPELGLAAFGDKGISFHRDATYAAPIGLIINLGGVTWGIDMDRDTSMPSKIVNAQHFTLDSGEVLAFNSKHFHQAPDPAADRWSIVLWQVSRTRRDEFQCYLRGDMDGAHKNRLAMIERKERYYGKRG